MDEKKVLIIDDSPVDCKIMSKILENTEEGFKISLNQNGKGVIKQLCKENIDVVILDLMIEQINGVDILTSIRKYDETINIPIIICSSIGDKGTIKETLTLGAYDYFVKPLSDMAMDFGFALKVKNAVNMRKKTKRLSYLMNHDELTGLKTRKYLENQLYRYTSQDVFPVSVILIDINGLKVINDAYGHNTGDKVLVEISSKIKKILQDMQLVARWGSDEIAILYPKVNEIELRNEVAKLKKTLDHNKEFSYDISFGWASAEWGSYSWRFLFQKAEDNLYSNKIMDSTSIRSKMIESIVSTLHQKNPVQENHSHRVSFLAGNTAKILGFSEYEIKRVRLAGLMHDIGKIAISDDILNKTTKLEKEEWNIIKKHPEIGFKILSTSVDTMEIAKAVLAHHERFDGSGYPKGIKGEQIPVMARIISVADAFDAMTSSRRYKRLLMPTEAFMELRENAGSQFDPMIVDAFLNSFERKNSMHSATIKDKVTI